jgi:hypothetical protein
LTQQRIRRQALSSISSFNDDVQKGGEVGGSLTPSATKMSSTETETGHSYSRSSNKNPLKRGKDGSQRLALLQSSATIGSVSHHQNPLEEDAIRYSSFSGLGSVSYFPDHVARVSYIASLVKPDANGNYLKDLQNGMGLLATRLAPTYFPGTIVRHITTQVDGYFPSGEF